MRCLLLSLAIIPTVLAVPPTLPYHRIIISESRHADDAGLRQEKCLATMIYGESRGEPELGQVSVAYTAINRSGKKTVCDVILAPKQYSIFNGNSSLRAAAMSLYIEPKHKNIIDEKAWIKAVKIAQDVMHRRVPDPTLGATHYVVYRSLTTIPAWTQTYKQTAKIGNHTFFKYVRPKQPNKMAIAISNSLS